MKTILLFLSIQVFIISFFLDLSFTLAPPSKTDKVLSFLHIAKSEKDPTTSTLLNKMNSSKNESTRLIKKPPIQTFFSTNRVWLETFTLVIGFAFFLTSILITFQTISLPLYNLSIFLPLSVLSYVGLLISFFKNKKDFIQKDQLNENKETLDHQIKKYYIFTVISTIQVIVMLLSTFILPIVLSIYSTYSLVILFSIFTLFTTVVLFYILALLRKEENLIFPESQNLTPLSTEQSEFDPTASTQKLHRSLKNKIESTSLTIQTHNRLVSYNIKHSKQFIQDLKKEPTLYSSFSKDILALEDKTTALEVLAQQARKNLTSFLNTFLSDAGSLHHQAIHQELTRIQRSFKEDPIWVLPYSLITVSALLSESDDFKNLYKEKYTELENIMNLFLKIRLIYIEMGRLTYHLEIKIRLSPPSLNLHPIEQKKSTFPFLISPIYRTMSFLNTHHHLIKRSSYKAPLESSLRELSNQKSLKKQSKIWHLVLKEDKLRYKKIQHLSQSFFTLLTEHSVNVYVFIETYTKPPSYQKELCSELHLKNMSTNHCINKINEKWRQELHFLKFQENYTKLTDRASFMEKAFPLLFTKEKPLSISTDMSLPEIIESLQKDLSHFHEYSQNAPKIKDLKDSCSLALLQGQKLIEELNSLESFWKKNAKRMSQLTPHFDFSLTTQA